MNLSNPPSDRLNALVLQLGNQLQGANAEPSGLESALSTARDLERSSLEAGQPLLAGAAICLQQRISLFIDSPAVGEELTVLAQAWLAHGPQLLAPLGDPALDSAWTALQPHLAVSIEESETPPALPEEVEPAAPAPEMPVDAGAFLDSLDAPESPAPISAEAAVDAGAFLDSLDAAPEATAFAARGKTPQKPARKPAQPKPTPAPIHAAEEPVPPEILEAFAQESREAFESMEQSIMAWEKDDRQVEDLRNVFRLAHSVKGAANSVGLRAVGTVLHRLEDMLEDLVEGRGRVATGALSALVLSLIDILRTALASGQSASPAWKETADLQIKRIADLRATMTSVAVGETPTPVEVGTHSVERAPVVQTPAVEPVVALVKAAPPQAKPALVEAKAEQSTIRVETSHLDKLMNLVGDLLINRHRLNRKLQQVTSLRGELVRARERLLHVVGDFNTRYEFSQRRHAAVQASADGFSELELDRYDDFNILSRSLVEIAADAEEIVTQIDSHFGSFSEEAVQFTNVTRKLQEDVARTRMVPLDQLFRRLQRAVRDAASSEGKEISFVVEGAENRIDKSISDQLFRPLLHIVRNAVAHGIEPAAERLAAGKPAEGHLMVRSRTEAGRLALELTDDGGGLHRDAIIRVARERGLLGANTTPDDAQLAELIFQPGFSTATTTTDVSGRGVGLDVVRQDLINLGGMVSVVSRPGQGCSFVLTLPVTLAINQVMFVQCDDRVYALPINFVERVVPAPASSFSLSGHSEMLMLDKNQTVPVVRLHARLGLPDNNQAATAIILTLAERRTALIVDRIQSKIDIVVKPLGPLLNRHPFFSGATLAGDGRVIFILDVSSLLAPGATRARDQSKARAPEVDHEVHESIQRILVVDDSLSIRRIAANYLTRAGLEVDTAVDGSDALDKLRTNSYALVVSDLEMPRVNGFELIAEMHRQPDLEKIPVIILTSRDAAKHRDRARELGAADYLIKPVSREQLTDAVSALLERADAA